MNNGEVKDINRTEGMFRIFYMSTPIQIQKSIWGGEPKLETSRLKCSLLIPTYMENENLPVLVKSLEENFGDLNLEVIFIDDNSPDGTAKSLKELIGIYDNMKLLVRPCKMGLGSAYKDGFKVTSGEVIVEMDADLSHNPRELPRLVKALNYLDADVVVGSRYVSGGAVLGWKWYRRLISRTASLLASLVLNLNVNDATSGFRAYKRKAFEKIVSQSRLNGFEFQVEALYIAKKLQLKTVEVPITFKKRIRGRSKMKFTDILNFLQSVFKMLLNNQENWGVNLNVA
jgi:dolichol-phosphate mannosyltransferase